MKRYVLGFYRMPSGFVLILKTKPLWAAGKFNGIGGSIEDGETPLMAMVREFREEAGLDTQPTDWRELLTLRGGVAKTSKPWLITVFMAHSETDRGTWPRKIDEGMVNVYSFVPKPIDVTANWLLEMCWDFYRNGILTVQEQPQP